MSKEKVKKEVYVLQKPRMNWRELMGRAQKRFRNRWNTEVKPWKENVGQAKRKESKEKESGKVCFIKNKRNMKKYRKSGRS